MSMNGKEISSEQIENESKPGYRPLAIESGITTLPLSDLGDREFELLTYLLISKEIENNLHPNISAISLMQGRAERGRDCVLYKDGKVCGLVQCKKYNSRITRPQALREIIKFLLFSILDDSILPDPKNFEYKLYVSSDFNEPTIALLYTYNVEIEKEISSGNISKYIKQVVEEYESFSSLKTDILGPNVIKLLRSITVSSCNGTELSKRIYNYENILTLFFNVKTVISLQGADNLIRNALDDYGLKYLTDADLKNIQSRISNASKDNRVNLGYVDFFGYNKLFFKSLTDGEIKKIVQCVTELNMLLSKKQMDFIHSEINKSILSEVTAKLLGTKKIHPFSVGLAAPYLFDRLTLKLVAGSLPQELLEKYYPQSLKTQNELIEEISNKLFKASERVMAGDISHLAGNSADVQFKISIYSHMHQGFESISDAKETFDKDIKILVPTLEKIEEKISQLISEEKTIVIKDASFFDNKEEVERISETLKVID